MWMGDNDGGMRMTNRWGDEDNKWMDGGDKDSEQMGGDKDNTGGTTMGMDSHVKHALLARFSPTLSC